jgi:hypothetical protein
MDDLLSLRADLPDCRRQLLRTAIKEQLPCHPSAYGGQPVP